MIHTNQTMSVLIARALTKVLLSSDQVLEGQLDAIIANVINAFAKAEASELAEDGKRLWTFFRELSTQLKDKDRACPQIAVPELSQKTLDPWKDIRTHCLTAFAPQEFSQWIDSLGKVESYAQKLQTPEGRVLGLLSRKWRERLTAESQQPTQLSCSAVPDLVLADDPAGPARFAVVVCNGGDAQARNIQVTVSGAKKIDVFPQIQDWLPKGNCTSEIYRVEHQTTVNGKVNIRVDYTDSSNEPKKAECSFVEPGLNEPVYQGTFRNPYVAVDRPLKKGEPYVGKKREQVRQDIENTINKETGGIFSLWGLRRIGKTSFLYRLMDDANNGKLACLCAYINCILFEGEKPWSSQELFGLIARVIRSEMEEKCIPCDELPRYRLDERITKTTFIDFIDKTLRILNQQSQKLLILLDDADMFGETLPDGSGWLFDHKDLKENVMPTLECLAKRHSGDPGLFIIFSTERALGDLWENLYVQPSWRVPLLDRIDLLPRPHNQETRGQSSQRQSDETLVNWGAIPLHYSYLASEYLWRITGGHPALAQLICANVVREWHERGHRTQVVRLELIRKVVRDLVEDTDLAGFFRYIYQYSIPQPARKTFMRMIKEMRIDSRTLQIQCSELPDADLLQLKDRDIIEKRNGTWFLRLGFYKLWLEKYPPMDSTNA